MAALKLNQLPDRTPKRLSVAVSPELYRLLQEYAATYRSAYGQDEGLSDLIPFMLQAFIDGDRDFRRARRERPEG